jgi:hypothetical protein
MKRLSGARLGYAWPALLMILVICQYGCSSCNTKKPDVDAQLILQGAIGTTCDFSTLVGTGKQSIEIWIRQGTGGVATQHYLVSNVPNLTYNIQVPSSGSFRIEVNASEQDGLSCPMCAGFCNSTTSAKDGHPYWSGVEISQLGGATGSIYTVVMKPCGSNGCCGC